MTKNNKKKKNSAIPVVVPLLNPNEDQAQLVELYVNEKQFVSKDDLICTLETTKSTNDILAETEGYILNILADKGDMVSVGSTLCYIASSEDWEPSPEQLSDNSQSNIPIENLRISKPALQLAKEAGVSLKTLPSDVFITKEFIQKLIKENSAISPEQNLTPSDFLKASYSPNNILVFGGGGHGKAIIDLLGATTKYQIAGIIDDGIPPGAKVMGVPVLGGKNMIDELFSRGVINAANAVGGISNVQLRISVFDLLSKAGFTFPILVHPTAFVEPSATLAEGAQIFPHAYVGSEATIGFGNIINTGAIISHDCALADYVIISPGAILAGKVQIGENTLIGMGVTINLNVSVGKSVRIGNGATIKADIPDKKIIKAGAIWP